MTHTAIARPNEIPTSTKGHRRRRALVEAGTSAPSGRGGGTTVMSFYTSCQSPFVRRRPQPAHEARPYALRVKVATRLVLIACVVLVVLRMVNVAMSDQGMVENV